MKIVFDNEDFDGQFLRALSYAAYGGADIGECFETANNIKGATATVGTTLGRRPPSACARTHRRASKAAIT